ncbi:MAG TPA: hypothetical protein VG273_24385 [Bryobacteraceae bacterium]|jgi:hypothetical protein|nr:hypothetical protein [Bryobacteraceae bacterium]
MNHVSTTARAAAAALAVLLAGSPLSAQTPKPAPKATTAKVSLTPDGHPDLQGVWTNATLTPMQRPAAFAGKATVSEAEATAYEKKDLSVNDIDKPDAPLLAAAGSGSGATAVGGYNNLFMDRGSELAKVDGVKRTSLIVDPADGKVPPITPEARKRNGAMRMTGMRFDNVKDRPLSERCIVGFGSTSGPPMLPVLYNNNYQIVQTPGTVMILVEMDHDARIVRMNGTHPPKSVHQWLGDSIGHWDGDTLVVDTTNFTNETRFAGSSEDLHVVERFRRIDANTILYKATIDDPTTFTSVWTMEFPFVRTAGPVYEYACHEGNYAMTDILGGARKLENETKPK